MEMGWRVGLGREMETWGEVEMMSRVKTDCEHEWIYFGHPTWSVCAKCREKKEDRDNRWKWMDGEWLR